MTNLSEREMELPDATIGKLLKIAVEDKAIVSLGPGEPDFDTPKPIVNHLKQLMKKEIGHYSPPGGRAELKEALIKKLKKKNRIKADKENMIVTCGSQESLLLATACTLDVSEQVIIPNPSFLGYLPTFELFNANPVFVKLKEDLKFEVDPDDVRKVIDKKKTKVVILNTPANPTGGVIRKKILEELADIARQYDLYLFSDEAYEDLIYDKKHFSVGSLNGMEDNIVSFFTFSKSYAMCGYRVGYCVGPDHLINAMTKTHIYSTLSAPTISQMLAVKALSISDKYVQKMAKEYRRRRDLLVKGLNSLNLTTNKPDGAFYTFSNISEYSKNSFKFAHELLAKAKVAVVPGKEFGRDGEGYIRCSYATDYNLIQEAVNRMEKYLK
tara:strand:- start:8674 stop:9822 length:1149 start_codon:yes stop_codon:yes gene_type:complete